MVEVVTVWAPRPDHDKWRGGLYMQLLSLQKQSCQRVGHRHRVVTDAILTGYDTIQASLPASLMHALIAGQIAFLRQWDDKHHVVLMDVDCLVGRDLIHAFSDTWDIALTVRDHPTQPIQNGVIYLAPGARSGAIAMLERTLELTEGWWGSDQVALAKAMQPIHRNGRIRDHYGSRVIFLPTEEYNFTNKFGIPKRRKHFVFHFKGDAKQYAAPTAREYGLAE